MQHTPYLVPSNADTVPLNTHLAGPRRVPSQHRSTRFSKELQLWPGIAHFSFTVVNIIVDALGGVDTFSVGATGFGVGFVDGIGVTIGFTIGLNVGFIVGLFDGFVVGKRVGFVVEVTTSFAVGFGVGCGVTICAEVTFIVGLGVTTCDGITRGTVGLAVGRFVGCNVGKLDGFSVGITCGIVGAGVVTNESISNELMTNDWPGLFPATYTFKPPVIGNDEKSHFCVKDVAVSNPL